MSISQERTNLFGIDNAGFSLIEALIAIVIFVIGILGVYTLQINATQGNTLANRVSTAANWSAYAIEEVLGQNYDDLYVGSGIGTGKDLERMNDKTDANPSDGIIYVQPDGQLFKSVFVKQSDNPPVYSRIDDDGFPGDPLYAVYYNIATGEAGGANSSVALNDTKIIRTHVWRNGGIGDGHLFSHTYYKAKWPEAEE